MTLCVLILLYFIACVIRGQIINKLAIITSMNPKMLEAKVKQIVEKGKTKIVSLRQDTMAIIKQSKTLANEVAKVKDANEEKKKSVASLRKQIMEIKKRKEELYHAKSVIEAEIKQTVIEQEEITEEKMKRKCSLEAEIKKLHWEINELISKAEQESKIHKEFMDSEKAIIEKTKDNTQKTQREIIRVEKWLEEQARNETSRTNGLKKEQKELLGFLSAL